MLTEWEGGTEMQMGITFKTYEIRVQMKEEVLSASSHLINQITSYSPPVMQPFLLSLFGLIWLSGFVHLPALIPTFLHCPCHPFACLKVNSRRFLSSWCAVCEQTKWSETHKRWQLLISPASSCASLFLRPAPSWYCFSSLPVLRLLSVLHLFSCSLSFCLFTFAPHSSQIPLVSVHLNA